MEASFARWKSDSGADAAVEFVRQESEDDGGMGVFAFRSADCKVTVGLVPIEDASFFLEALDEDAPEDVESWVADANSFMADRPKLILPDALDYLVRSVPACLGVKVSKGSSASCGGTGETAPEEDDAFEADDDDLFVSTIDEGEDRSAQRRRLEEEKMWEGMVTSSSSQGSRQASQVLMREMRTLLQMQGDGSNKALQIDMVNDSLYNWSVKMHADGFPDECPLKAELVSFASSSGKEAAIIMEVVFPDTFPHAPPFIRVVRPRFQMHTGHITIGGSVCMEALTPSGWRPTFSIENVFVEIRCQMIEGGGRLDFQGSLNDYTPHEARAAFQRVAQNYGWLK